MNAPHNPLDPFGFSRSDHHTPHNFDDLAMATDAKQVRPGDTLTDYDPASPFDFFMGYESGTMGKEGSQKHTADLLGSSTQDTINPQQLHVSQMAPAVTQDVQLGNGAQRHAIPPPNVRPRLTLNTQQLTNSADESGGLSHRSISRVNPLVPHWNPGAQPYNAQQSGTHGMAVRDVPSMALGGSAHATARPLNLVPQGDPNMQQSRNDPMTYKQIMHRRQMQQWQMHALRNHNHNIPVELTLGHKIMHAITPFKNVLPCPFTTAELVVMALVCRGPQTKQGIVRWLCKNFDEFQEAAENHLADNLGQKYLGGEILPVEPRSHDFDLLHQLYDVPIYLTGSLYSTNPPEARIFLNKYLDLPYKAPRTSDQPCGFFKLSAELRNMIYDMLFVLSKHGIVVDCTANLPQRIYQPGQRQMVRVIPDSIAEATTIQHWNSLDTDGKFLYAPKLSQILSTTMVFKQWYKETSKYFYLYNTFICLNVDHMNKLLTKLPEKLLPSIEHLSFAYIGFWNNDTFAKNKRVADAAFKLLAKLPNLRTLNIDACSSRWTLKG